ncbi:MAG: SDR family oxidoreductase [Gemmatimonadales bacterium]|nr:SDR family oxidoreductase [Gemmatimonadales bacterium]
MRLENRTAIITGGAQGIGRAIAERFIAEGARVMIADVDAKRLAVTAKELGCASGVADVASKDDVDRFVAAAVKELGHVDILVNNAGITHAADFLELDVADFDRVLGINLRGAFLASQAVGRHMASRGQGVIINMSSVNAILAIPNQVPYAVSKGALGQLTRVMALGLAPHGIRVNAIGPGTILTDLARTIMTDEAAQKKILSRTPIGRCGEPSEVASVAVFLASDDASYLMGQTIYPDGGRLALNYTV